jgi:uncharacterized protein
LAAGAVPPSPEYLGGIYVPEVTRRTYEECLRRAEGLLFQGRRVLIDASFREDSQRRLFLDAARRWAVPGIFFVCQADPEVARQRLAQRRGDASDADWSVYLSMAAAWEAPAPSVAAVFLDSSQNKEQILSTALAALVTRGIY